MLAATMFVGSAATASAACLLSDAAGVWIGYSYNNTGDWATCRFTIGSTGIVAPTTCKGSSGETAAFTNGKLTLASGPLCIFTGSFILGGEANTIKHATLSRDKISFEGVGTFADGTFVFSMTKI